MNSYRNRDKDAEMVTPKMLREQANGMRQSAAQARLRAQYADDPSAYRADLDNAERLIADASFLEREAMRLEAVGV